MSAPVGSIAPLRLDLQRPESSSLSADVPLPKCTVGSPPRPSPPSLRFFRHRLRADMTPLEAATSRFRRVAVALQLES